MEKNKMIAIVEAVYIVFMWNFFKTTITFHNIWEAPLMNLKKMPKFFFHEVNTNNNYSNKICPWGNYASYFIALWIVILNFFINKKSQKNFKTINTIVFIGIGVLSFLMNLNAFIYILPIILYELFK